jgi:hypothetical protein
MDYDVGALYGIAKRHEIEDVTFDNLNVGMTVKVTPGKRIAMEIIVDDDPMLVDEPSDDCIGDESGTAGYEVSFHGVSIDGFYPQSFTRLG